MEKREKRRWLTHKIATRRASYYPNPKVPVGVYRKWNLTCAHCMCHTRQPENARDNERKALRRNPHVDIPERSALATRDPLRDATRGVLRVDRLAPSETKAR